MHKKHLFSIRVDSKQREQLAKTTPAGFSELFTTYCSTEVLELLPDAALRVDNRSEKLHVATSSPVPVRDIASMLFEFLRAC